MQPKYFKIISILTVCSGWICAKNTLAQNDICRTLEFTSVIDGQALENHVIKNISLESQDTCRMACYLDNACLSYNFGRLQDHNYVCQLSDSDHYQHPKDLQQRKGFVYRGTVNECNSNPCNPPGKCIIDPSDNKYRCTAVRGDWKKINNNPVCFGARGDAYGAFKIKEDGFIVTFKLVHKQGSVRCSYDFPASYWGCVTKKNPDKNLLTVITHSNNTALLIANYAKSSLCRYYAYQLDGVTVNSTELVFNKLSTPLWATVGQEFRIWYGHDMVDCSEFNNCGQTCADVYAWYN
ncbi:hypothetical protein ACROYT_G022157 [Oculina patagonica]